MSLSPEQCIAARGLLRWTQRDLARKAAGVSISTVKRFEQGTHATTEDNLARIRKALERGGVLFIDANGNAGLGVRLKK